MPGCGQPRLPSGKVTASADTTTTCSTGTPASRATSATTGSTTDAGRSTAPGPALSCVGWFEDSASGPSDDDAAEQPATTHRAAISVIRITSIIRWYRRSDERAETRLSLRRPPGRASAPDRAG